MGPKSLKDRVYNRLSALKTERSPWITDWQDVSDYVLGVRGRFLGDDTRGTATTDTRPERNEALYNETAKFAANTLASGMMAGITSPARPWFKLTPPDPEMADYGPVKEYLDDVEKILLTIFAKSNFYNSMHTVFRDLGMFGTAAIGAYEDFDTVVRYEPYPIGSFCIAQNGKREVDTLYREYSMTVGAVVGKFGLEKVSQTVRNLWNNCQYDERVDIIHAIEPNDGRKYDSPLAADMPWRSVYFEKGGNGNQPLMKSGFRNRPFFAPRWTTMGEDVYSIIYPGSDSLGTNKALQVQEMDKAIAIEKMHNPPLIGDASLANEPLDLIAGGVTYAANMAATGKPGLSPVYDVNPRINELVNDIKEKENRILRHFYADLFLMVTEMDRAQITATEIAERKEEKLLMLGPVLESLNHEMLDPNIDRAFAIAQRAGILPPPPEELQNGSELKVEYISILAQAQKAVSTASMEATAVFAMNLAAANPDALDKIDMDQMIDEHARAKGAPVKVIRSDDDVAEIRENRAQQMQQQQMMEQAAQAIQGAKTLSETSTDGDNALAAMMGQ